MLQEYQVLYLDNDIPINRSFYCNNGDIKSRGLEVHVLDNSQAKDCTGLTIKMIVKVPSGEMFEATVANGLVTVLNAATGIYQILFPNNMGRGRLIAEIQLSNAVPEVIVSRKFSIAGDGSLTSDGSISALPAGGLLWNVLTNETQRQVDFVGVLGSLDAEVATKYAELEQTYAPELNLVKSQLATKATQEPFHLYVGVNQLYKTITSAVNEWKNPLTINKEPAIIHIAKGIYNECVYLSGTSNLSFIGEGKKLVTWKTTTGYYPDAPLAMGGNALIKGITFIADHTSNPSFEWSSYSGGNTGVCYAVHIDDTTSIGEVVIEDCDMISYQSAGLGSGTRVDQQIRLTRCGVFSYSPFAQSILSGAWLYHSSSTVGGTNQKVYAKDCYFYSSGGKPVYLRSFNTDVTIPIEFINCNFSSGVVVTSFVEFTDGVKIIITDNSSGNNENLANGLTYKKILNGGTEITDLNNATFGRFLCNGSAGGLNTPTAEWCLCDVISWSATRSIQYAYTFLNNFNKYKRINNGGVWTSWKALIEEKEPINTNDLNLINNGKFSIETGGLNTPTNSTYIGEAISYSGTAGKVQYAYAVLDGMKKYKRSYTGGAWSTWVLIAEP